MDHKDMFPPRQWHQWLDWMELAKYSKLCENCHSTVLSKQANLSMMQYRRSFGQTMKESNKSVSHTMGGLLLYEREAMARGNNIVSKYPWFKTVACSLNVISQPLPSTGLGFLPRSGCEATHSTLGNNSGKAWPPTRVAHVPGQTGDTWDKEVEKEDQRR